MVALAAIFAVPALHAATFIVPPDELLIDDSKAIVSGIVIAAEPRYNEAGEIETVYTIQIEEVLKGRIAESRVTVVEWGGQIGSEVMVSSGAPRYEAGKSYLVFLTADRNGAWTTQHLTLGRFEKKNGRFVRDVTEVHGWDIRGNAAVEVDRDAEGFREFIRQRVAGVAAPAAYFVGGRPASVAASVTAGPIAPDFAEYDFEDASEVGVSAWANDSGSTVEYSIGSDTSDTVVDLNPGADKLIEEDPNDVIPGVWTGSGVLAVARWRSTTGTPLNTIIGSNVITQKGIKTSTIGQSKFRTAMVHEIGHTLGFRHSNESCTTAVPCTSDAVMNSSVGSLNGVLKPWDINAVRAVYGTAGGAENYVTGKRTNTSIAFKLAKEVCAQAGIGTQPAPNTNLGLGSTVQLSVTGSGSAPYSYQWYEGTSPDTTKPITGATTSKLNVTPQVVGTYHLWVRVSNACGSVNSNTAVIVVTCQNPAISASPQSVTISQGQSTQLSVTATGSGLSYQWFKGESGDRSNPVGTNSNKLTVSPAETSKYWVRVSSTCGPGVDSATATVTVASCAAITVNTPTATPVTGNNFTLAVTASSSATPLTFEWFRGNTPGVGGEKVGSTQNVTVAVPTPATFWARVRNACGRTEVSSLLAVGCTLPAITAEPQDQTINSGQSANLAIAFTGGTGVKWYRGVVGDKTNEVGSAGNVTVGPLTETTLYWAEVSSSCGPVASRQVTVTVRALSELVPMLGGRFFVQVNYKNQFDNGKEGKMQGRSLFSTPLSETLVFTFGDPNVVELLVRLSDARPFDDSIHVFLGGLSDVEFSVVVTDSLTGIIHEYRKPPNELVGVIDRQTFPAAASLPIMAATPIVPAAESSTIHLLNGRFEVRMRYRNQFTNPAGEGYMNARSVASSPTTETAVFFFDENVGSVEWMVRFSDARPFAERIDMFHGGLSDVEFTIEVHDTKTGERKEYHKGPFSLRGQVDRDSYQP